MPTKSIIRSFTMALASVLVSGIAHADVELSGQINRMIANMDNGAESEVEHLDNSGSGTRIRIKGEHDAGNGLKVGFYWETQYQSNDSSDAEIDAKGAQDDNSDDDGDNGGFQARHRDIYISGSFGRISLGQGNGAANGITEMEYTGTTFLTGSANPQDLWRELNFVHSDPDFGNLEVGDVYDGMDALSRNDRLRYDSPKLGPFTVSVDSGNGGKTEAAIRFEADLGRNSKIKGGIGGWDEKDAKADVSKGVAGSFAYLHGSGINVALAFGELDEGNDVKPKSGMLILGFKRGNHAFSLRGGTTEDKEPNISADASGFGYVNTSITATELYLGYQLFELDIESAEELSIVFAGARVKF